MKIIDHLLKNPDDRDLDFIPLLHGSMKSKTDSIRLALDGMITVEQQQKIKIILCHYSEIKKCKADLESIILSLSEPYARQCSLVSTVPGIKNPFSAIAIISEIGVDMSVFLTAKHLCSWAGLTPQNNESAGKRHSVRISRAGVYIKPLLVQCANAVWLKSKAP
jgi:transposase